MVFLPGLHPGHGRPAARARPGRSGKPHSTATAWLAAHGIPWQGERLISLFCYEPPALAAWLAQLARGPEPTRLLVTHGRAAAAVRAAIFNKIRPDPASNGDSSLLISYLPALTQRDYDAPAVGLRPEPGARRRLLGARPAGPGGRWSGRSIRRTTAPTTPSCRPGWTGWAPAPRNARFTSSGTRLGRPWPTHRGPHSTRTAWQPTARAARSRLLAQDDLCTQLIRFVAKTR